MSPMLEESLQHVFAEIIEKFTFNNMNIFQFEFEYTPWVFSVLGSIAISLMGVLPLLIIPVDTGGSEFSDRKLRIDIEFRLIHDIIILLFLTFSGRVQITKNYLKFCCRMFTW